MIVRAWFWGVDETRTQNEENIPVQHVYYFTLIYLVKLATKLIVAKKPIFNLFLIFDISKNTFSSCIAASIMLTTSFLFLCPVFFLHQELQDYSELQRSVPARLILVPSLVILKTLKSPSKEEHRYLHSAKKLDGAKNCDIQPERGEKAINSPDSVAHA